MIQHNQLHFMHAKDSDKEEILALYHSLVGTEYCAWTQEYPGEKEFAYDMGRDALFCLKNDKGEIVGTITIDQDPEVEALSCWSKDRQPSAELSRLGANATREHGIVHTPSKTNTKYLRRHLCRTDTQPESSELERTGIIAGVRNDFP